MELLKRVSRFSGLVISLRWPALAGALCICVVSVAGCYRLGGRFANKISPEDALRRFYDHKGPEYTLMDPLIIAGDEVVPLVLKEIQNKNMPRRRYAIRFLGNGSYSEALPLLTSILVDSSEEDYFRGDALISIYLIDEAKGKKLARTYRNEQNHLRQISEQVLTDYEEIRKRRSYLEAVAGEGD